MSAEGRRARFAHLPTLAPRLGTLPTAQLALWPSLGQIPESFVLYGGTALALHLGHRVSVDFDFFSSAPFVPTTLLDQLPWLGPVVVNDAAPDHLVVTTAAGVDLSFFGSMDLQPVAEASLVESSGLVVASIFDLAGTKAKAILDRSEWRDYVDLATLLRHGLTLPEIIGYATTIFAARFEFPVAVFLRALAWFGDGTAADVEPDLQRELERAAVAALREPIPIVAPYATSIGG